MPRFQPRGDLSNPLSCGGESTLKNLNYDVLDVVSFMFAPLRKAMETALEKNNRVDLMPLVTKYMWFRVGLGMIRPVRVDDVWMQGELGHNEYLAGLVTRAQYYDLVGATKGSIPAMLEGCNAQWEQGWKLGKAATGDETIVPHKGKRAGHLRQFVPRKPHNTGLKLYCLADSVHAYTLNVYLFTGVRGKLSRRSTAAGSLTPSRVLYRWADALPIGTAIIADSYFGSVEVARTLCARRIPFIMLAKRTTRGVDELKAQCNVQEIKSKVIDGGCKLCVFKNRPVGRKPARIVPLLHNVKFSGRSVTHHLGYEIPPAIYAYRQLAGGVDTANQMALQHREVGRCSTWAQAVRYFLLRYAMTNAFATCRFLKLLPKGERMYAFQWACMKAVCGEPLLRHVGSVHAPLRRATRTTCHHCRDGASLWGCSGCKEEVRLHVKCFADFHAD